MSTDLGPPRNVGRRRYTDEVAAHWRNQYQDNPRWGIRQVAEHNGVTYGTARQGLLYAGTVLRGWGGHRPSGKDVRR